MPGSRQHRCFL